MLPNISKGKGNQIMKIGQLIDITWEIVFSKNYTQNVAEKLVLDPFLKCPNWAYIWFKKFYTVWF